MDKNDFLLEKLFHLRSDELKPINITTRLLLPDELIKNQKHWICED